MAKGLGSKLIVGLMVLVGLPAQAQDRDRTIRQFHHTAWTSKDGAPPEIWALDQSPDGFLWLGTGTGLHRFDGVRFEHFRPAPGQRLASIDITAVKVVASNEIWIGYSDGGISRLRDGHVTTFLEEDGIWPGMVVRIVEDRDGILWAVSHGGLSRFENGQWRRLGTDWDIPADILNEMFLANDGTLWLSSTESIYFLRPGARRFEPTGAVAWKAAFTQTPDGRLWVADGLHGLRPLPHYPAGDSRNLWTLKPATASDVLSVASYAVDRRGVIWGTDRVKGGIFRFDPLHAQQPTHSLLSSDVDVFRRSDGLTSDRSIPILADREGNIWVGTNAGLDRFRDADITHDPAVPGATAFAYSIAAMPDATYISDGAGLYRAAPNEGARPFARLPMPAATMLFRTRDGALWYSNDDFVHRLRDGTITRLPLPEGVVGENIRAFAEGDTGTLWVVFPSGTYQLKDGVWSGKIDLGLPTPSIAASDPAGAVWFGFSDGRLARRDSTGVRVFSALDGLEVGDVEDIVIRDGVVWVGGEYGVAWSNHQRFRTVGPDRVAPLFGISGLGWTAGGDLLFNGLMGVVRMKADELGKVFADPSHSPIYRLYDRNDGLPGVAQQGWHSPTVATGADGRIWLVSNTGVAVLNSDGSERNRVPPPVTLVSATAQGVGYLPIGPLTLPRGTSSLAIAYTAASLSVPDRVRFKYQLEGLDPDWVDAGGHREAVYNNLGPGRYRFRVIAANEDGVWNTDGATLAIELPPTFLQSWPFKLLCTLTGVGLLWLAYSMRLRVVTERIRMRMAERMEERERIARELHDTLLQSVQALTFYFQDAVSHLPKEERARTKFESALDRADAVIAESRDRIWDLRATRDPDIDRTIATIVERQAFDPGVEVTVAMASATRPLEPLVLEEATRIASEALFNIRRHARATRVAIDISHGATFTLRITDNGVGLRPEVADRGQKDGHFGLSGMRERARSLRGSCTVRAVPEGGTEVMLTVPGPVAYKTSERRTSLW